MATTYETVSSAAVLRPMRFPYPMVTDHPEPRKIELLGRRTSTWVSPVARSLGLLARLTDDWDGRGSRAINFDDVRDALDFLQRVMRDDTPAPSIGPLSSGGIELSWHGDDLEVEAIFDHQRGEQVLLVSSGSNETEEPIECAEKLFADLVDRLGLAASA